VLGSATGLLSGRSKDARCSPKAPTVGTLQTLPAAEEDDRYAQVVKEAGFSLHAGVAAKAWERDKLERLCRYISRPAVSEKRLSLTSAGNVRSTGSRHPTVMARHMWSLLRILRLRH